MGGGKTHNLLALGLLAQHPEWRDKVMAGFHKPQGNLSAVRVAAFSGRQNDMPYGIWGEIARQIGKETDFAPYYNPLAVPGQEAWVNLLRGEPLIILLDELPPYFNNARTKPIGMGTLADLTTTALANLMIAVSSNKLENVVLVLTDLSGASYQEGQQFINQALQNAAAEAIRLSAPIDPIRMNTDEFYHILRTRLFADLPAESEIQEVARAYGQALRQARAMDITTASPEQFAADIESSYPFHPCLPTYPMQCSLKVRQVLDAYSLLAKSQIGTLGYVDGIPMPLTKNRSKRSLIRPLIPCLHMPAARPICFLLSGITISNP